MMALRRSVLAIGGFVLAIMSSGSCALAQAIVTDCDKLAAHPTDPAKAAPGVTFSELDASLAVPACEEASREYPSSDRMKFQLARAYNKANRFGEAIDLYDQSARAGNALAMSQMGSYYWLGRGAPADDLKAYIWHRLAVDAGSQESLIAIADIVSDAVGHK